jgi:hypothetical protein
MGVHSVFAMSEAAWVMLFVTLGVACVGALGCGGSENGATRRVDGAAEAGVPARDAEAPVHHRAVAASCPTMRGPGSGAIGGCATCCSSDSDCDGGANGRCKMNPPAFGPNSCSYDACFDDSDCLGGTPCICRTSATDNSANTCAPGGNCVLDSNCGPGGYCSPSPLSQCVDPEPYYCHTSMDACINDADCPPADGGIRQGLSPVCTYDALGQRWVCGQQSCPAVAVAASR